MVKREVTDWGAQLEIKPFADLSDARSEMLIRADVAGPRGKHGPDVKIWFSGTQPRVPLRVTDVVVWQEALRALADAAKSEAEQLKRA